MKNLHKNILGKYIRYTRQLGTLVETIKYYKIDFYGQLK